MVSLELAEIIKLTGDILTVIQPVLPKASELLTDPGEFLKQLSDLIFKAPEYVQIFYFLILPYFRPLIQYLESMAPTGNVLQAYNLVVTWANNFYAYGATLITLFFGGSGAAFVNSKKKDSGKSS